MSKPKTYKNNNRKCVRREGRHKQRQAPHQTKINYWCNIMKLTQKWVNGSCDNYDQNSDKNESWCSQATTTTAHARTRTHEHSYPQKKSERNVKKQQQQHKTKKNGLKKQQILPDVRQHRDNKTEQKRPQKKQQNERRKNGWGIIKWIKLLLLALTNQPQISSTAWVVAGQTRTGTLFSAARWAMHGRRALMSSLARTQTRHARTTWRVVAATNTRCDVDRPSATWARWKELSIYIRHL